MFANIPAHHIKLAMRMNGDLDGAITWLLNYSKNVKEGFSDIIDVLDGFKASRVCEKTLQLEMDKSNLWREALLFYKTSLGDVDRLKHDLCLTFEGEQGVDGGALTLEFFSNFFEYAKKELFVSTDNKKCLLVQKQSGGNSLIYKVLGMAIAYSLISWSIFQNFPFLGI